MQIVLDAIGFLLNLGLILPIVVFVLAVVLGAGWRRALRSAVTLGVAFIGIYLVVGLLWNSLGDAASALSTRTGLPLNVVDLGWPTAVTIAYAGTVGPWVIVLSLLLNIVLLAARLTKTLNIDIWNFWHFAFTGALVYVATDNFLLALAAAAVHTAITLFLADWTARPIQNFFGLPSVSVPHGFSAVYVPLALPLNKLLDMIPGVRDWEADAESIQARLGLWGEPVAIGILLGVIFGVVGGFDAAGAITLAVQLGAAMLLFPRVVQILMEGLLPLQEAARDFMQKRFADREIYIGLDSANLIGHPSAMAAGLLLIPVTFILAIVLAAIGVNRVLPFVDLVTIPFMVVMILPLTHGNVARTIIIGAIFIAIGLLIATHLAEAHTLAALDARIEPPNEVQIASFADGMNPLTWALVQLSYLGWIGPVIPLVLLGIAWFAFRRREESWIQAVGGTQADDATNEE